MTIRTIKPEDAGAFATLLQQIDTESPYMLWEPGERVLNEERATRMIQTVTGAQRSMIFVAEECGSLAGYALFLADQPAKKAHCASIVIGIRQSFQGKGLGTAFFEKLSQWAAEQQITRLELTVITENEPAVALYQKAGFVIEGTKKHSIRMADRVLDEYVMAKLLTASVPNG